MFKLTVSPRFMQALSLYIKRKQLVGNTKYGKGYKLMALYDDKLRILALSLENTSRSKIKLVSDMLIFS